MKPVFQFPETYQNETDTGLASTNTPSDFWEDIILGESSIPRQDSSPKFIRVKNFHFPETVDYGNKNRVFYKKCLAQILFFWLQWQAFAKVFKIFQFDTAVYCTIPMLF